MPGKKFAFITRVECCIAPITLPRINQEKMVEAPGTAPGSATSILQTVYHHIWQASAYFVALNLDKSKIITLNKIYI